MRTVNCSRKSDITQLLEGVRAGKADAVDRLMAALYRDLRVMVRSVFAIEGRQHVLQPVAVVNEAFLRLFQPETSASVTRRSAPINGHYRAHFLAAAAGQIRLVLNDYSRQRSAKGVKLKVHLHDLMADGEAAIRDFETVDRLLDLLATTGPASARALELTCFGGLTDVDSALVVGEPAAKIRRDREYAQKWFDERMTAISPAAKRKAQVS